MASLKRIDMNGADCGTVEVSDRVFDAPANEALVHDVAVALMNARRQGTHKTKTRREVRGGGTKPFRQKGTGRARQGSIREPQMRGGGTVFGPVPRSYRQDIPVRFRRQALCCVLSDRARQDRLNILTGFRVDAPKTKPLAQMMEQVAPEGRKTLLITAQPDENVLLSARNLPRVMVRTAADLNALDVLRAVRIIVQEEALTTLEERLS
ncbi:MAG TPA: 50S ribosomal protein L4 [Candidatus Hydrogenedentes bacterium]|nr:50S ribosomal protein L4 [Candidatus Hydrogenedentota bacterium]